MTLARLSGATSLRDSRVSQLLVEWVDSSPLSQVRWAKATEVVNLPLIRNKQAEAMRQCAFLFATPGSSWN